MFNRTASKTLKLLALIVTASTVVYFLLDRLQWLYPPMVVREFESVDVFRPPTLELHPLTDTGGVHVVKHDLQVSSARNPRSAREDHAPMPNTVHAGEPFAHAQIRTFESKGGSVSAVTGGQQCMPVSYASTVRVLGRRVEKCVPMWKPDILALDFSQDDIYITVKTTQKNHNTRMLPIVLTWLQTVQPEQVHIVTDELGKDEELYKVHLETGVHISETNCKLGHVRQALCCKTGAQYAEYFSTVAKRDPQKPYRWFCHFDDDIYVNIPTLLAALHELSSMTNSTNSDFYLGRWPIEEIRALRRRNGYLVTEKNLQKLGISKPTIVVKWATGAAYCFSSSLVQKFEQHLKRHSYQEYCSTLRINDDLVAAVLAGVEGAVLHDDIRIKTQFDTLSSIPSSTLQSLITISYSDNNTVIVPGARFSVTEDPTRFLSYHCLLYPLTSWCQ